jgi:hypothetical protein
MVELLSVEWSTGTMCCAAAVSGGAKDRTVKARATYKPGLKATDLSG